MRSSAMMPATALDLMARFWNSPSGPPAVRHHFLHQPRAALDDAGMLQQPDIAGQDGGGEEAHRLPVGEIPGHDGEDGALRQPVDFGGAA